LLAPTDFLPLAVLMTGLLGSGHCLAMCGGIALIAAKSPSHAIQYHLGRLVSYLGLGIFAGFLGQHLIESDYGETAAIFSAVVLGMIFLWTGLQLVLTESQFSLPQFMNKWISIQWIQNRIKSEIKGMLNKSSFGVGFFSGFLPCGWLYTFVAASVALQSPIKSGLFLGLFWITTVPALSIFPYLAQKFNQYSLTSFRRHHTLNRIIKVSVGVLFIAIGTSAIHKKMGPYFYPTKPSGHDSSSCH
jgi:uncharacterized protein